MDKRWETNKQFDFGIFPHYEMSARPTPFPHEVGNSANVVWLLTSILKSSTPGRNIFGGKDNPVDERDVGYPFDVSFLKTRDNKIVSIVSRIFEPDFSKMTEMKYLMSRENSKYVDFRQVTFRKGESESTSAYSGRIYPQRIAMLYNVNKNEVVTLENETLYIHSTISRTYVAAYVAMILLTNRTIDTPPPRYALQDGKLIETTGADAEINGNTQTSREGNPPVAEARNLRRFLGSFAALFNKRQGTENASSPQPAPLPDADPPLQVPPARESRVRPPVAHIPPEDKAGDNRAPTDRLNNPQSQAQTLDDGVLDDENNQLDGGTT